MSTRTDWPEIWQRKMSAKDLEHVASGLRTVQCHCKTHATLHDGNLARCHIQQAKLGGDPQRTQLRNDQKVAICVGQAAV